MFSLNIIGAGRVGKTLGLLWQRSGDAEIQDVLTRSEESARAAVECIGAGTPITSWTDLRPADIYLLSVPDDALPTAVETLVQTIDVSGAIVFHTSGWLSSADLAPATKAGALGASVHPIKGFPDPLTAAESFPGTWGAIEGDQNAVKVLRPIFENIGAHLINLDTDKKPLYHTATIIACNYVVGLAALAQSSLVACGLESDQAMEMLIPLMRNTVDNLERLGPVQALTGPVVRGDGSTIAAHLSALNDWDKSVAHTYADLAEHLIDLASQQGTDPEGLERVRTALATTSDTH
jgi:predicted short-subunit dehydrogenase-like oxidoreductase (DUF2520 family)